MASARARGARRVSPPKAGGSCVSWRARWTGLSSRTGLPPSCPAAPRRSPATPAEEGVMRVGLVGAALAAAVHLGSVAHAGTTLLNVSYDPTRELYADVNKAFARHWKEQSGESVTIRA